MTLPKFKNEAQFRKNWLTPFFRKLGFTLVRHNHGRGEQGKDFYFAEYDRFDHRRFLSAQIKLGNIGVSKGECSNLLDQVKRSFAVRLRVPREANDVRIAAVYIIASGTISPEARQYISDWCDRENFGENVYYLDSETLERLEKIAH